MLIKQEVNYISKKGRAENDFKQVNETDKFSKKIGQNS
jgi:hypothetical protein